MNRALPFFLFLLIASGLSAQHPFFNPNPFMPIYADSLRHNDKNGYYFVAPWQLAPAVSPCANVVILDKNLDIAFIKTFPRPATLGFYGELIDFKVHPNGLMSYFFDDSIHTGFFILDSTFNIIDTLRCIDYPTDPHDMVMRDDGTFTLLCIERRTMDLSRDTGFGTWTMSNATDVLASGGIIQQINKRKQLQFEWHAFDHCQINDIKPYYIITNSFIDWTHGNTIYEDKDSNLIYSIRNFDQVMKISRKDSSVIWRLGGKRSDFTFPGDIGFISQHTALTIGDTMRLYDDGGYHNPPLARAVDYILDTAAHTANLSYCFNGPPGFTDYTQGNNQLLPDGGRLICWGSAPTGDGEVWELDENGNPVFQLYFWNNFKTYRAFYFDLPWTLHRPEIRCFMVDTQLYLAAPASASTFLWSSGDSTRIIKANNHQQYQVFVNYGVGMMGSEVYTTDAARCMDTVNTAAQQLSAQSDMVSWIYDGGSDQLKLYFAQAKDHVLMEASLYDMTGRKISESNISINGTFAAIPLHAELAKGTYVLSINLSNKAGTYYKKIPVY